MIVGGRTVFLSIVVAVVSGVAGAAAVLWWLAQPVPEPPLDREWTAVARVIAGDGVIGTRDGHADRARFADPFGVVVAASGSIIVSDAGDAPRIRMISTDGTVTTLAGGERGFADGVGVAAKFDTPSGVAVDARGYVYVADTANNAIRRVAPDGQVMTLAGDGIAGHVDGPGAQARFNGPVGVAVDGSGRVIVADTYNDRVRVIDADGHVGTMDGAFDTPCGVAVDAAGNSYVIEAGQDLVRVVAPGGAHSSIYAMSGLGVRPAGIAATPEGTLYITGERGRVLEISREWNARVLAGSGAGFADGSGHEARFRRPAGIAVAGPGALVVADAGNAVVRAVTATRRRGPLPASPLIAPQFDAGAFRWRPLLWPVSPMDGPHEVAGTLGEARGDSAERLHAGIDVRAEQGTPVLAVRPGVVQRVLAADDFGSLNERVEIGTLAYVHLRVGRRRNTDVLDPARFVATRDDRGRLTRVRVKRGARFETGEIIGTVNAFNHVHVNVGWPGEEHNPLLFRLPRFTDSVAPTIARGGIRLFDEQAQPLATRVAGRILVSGNVRIVVDAWDQDDGNRPGRRLGLYELGYQVLHPDATPVPAFGPRRDTLRFDRLAGDDAARLVYAPGSGIPFYGQRTTRFLYVVTNRLRGGVAEADVWDSSRLAPGDYLLRVRAADVSGNEALANRDVLIRIGDANEPGA